MLKKYVISVCLLLLFSSNVVACLSIVSDESWKTTSSPAVGWETMSFDDSGWNSALVRNDYPYPADTLIPGTTAKHIWDPSWSNTAYFRKSFSLDQELVSAELKMRFDDYYEFYINGTYVGTNVGMNLGQVQTYDIHNLLQTGVNSIAIKGWNSIGWWRSAVVDAEICQVPAPAALIMVLSGLAGIRPFRRMIK